MAAKEATARIRINQLLAQAGWRFFAENGKPANIALEANVTLVRSEIDDLGNDFESEGKGYIDFLLLDDRGKPLVVLEAKSETKHPLDGKEQARAYAKGKAQCRFVLLSNGLSHYFWDLEQGNPYQITAFPSPQSLQDRFKQRAPDSQRLVDAIVKTDYIALSQLPHYLLDPDYLDHDTRSAYLLKNKLRFLRPYQQQAIHALQRAVNEGQDRFLFEMATGTGKTLTTAAVIKLFLSTSNAHRVLFLVDRLELEDQALKAFSEVLKNDYRTVIYKQNRDDWRDADIVVTTVQSLLKYNKYQRLFSPIDFDCVISDEAHRSIGGNARAVFDYFVGYKLGLTATPRDYLKNTAKTNLLIEALETERRVLLDTYRTFGCADSQPTFRYTLLDGVREGYLINPTIVDARTSVTTQLMASGGFVVHATDENGISNEESFGLRAFEKRFFSEDTNRVLCQTIVQHGLRDPISGEFGKTLVFAVSQRHAAKLTQLLNEQAAIAFPNQYRSDFAVQVTSNVTDSQQFTGQFSDNKLLGNSLRLAEYKTSRARVCVTVGMMTTGYDSPTY
jgi:type I restriction enzyme, R subunit